MSDIAVREPLDRAALYLAAGFDRLSALLHGWATQLDSDRPLDSRSAAACDAFTKTLVLGAVTDPQGPVIGAGFVPVPGFFNDAAWHLSWWILRRGAPRGDCALVEQLILQEQPDQIDFHDHTRQVWWPERPDSDEVNIVGPYVDYLCSAEHVLTFTLPVEVDGRFVGVLALDAAVRRLEDAMLPALDQLGSPCLLVNGQGRVVLSSRSGLATGDLTDGQDASSWRRRAIGTTPFSLLVSGV